MVRSEGDVTDGWGLDGEWRKYGDGGTGSRSSA
jgi:hypothetical protein